MTTHLREEDLSPTLAPSPPLRSVTVTLPLPLPIPLPIILWMRVAAEILRMTVWVSHTAPQSGPLPLPLPLPLPMPLPLTTAGVYRADLSRVGLSPAPTHPPPSLALTSPPPRSHGPFQNTHRHLPRYRSVTSTKLGAHSDTVVRTVRNVQI
jgi:hypothetical protein